MPAVFWSKPFPVSPHATPSPSCFGRAEVWSHPPSPPTAHCIASADAVKAILNLQRSPLDVTRRSPASRRNYGFSGGTEGTAGTADCNASSAPIQHTIQKSTTSTGAQDVSGRHTSLGTAAASVPNGLHTVTAVINSVTRPTQGQKQTYDKAQLANVIQQCRIKNTNAAAAAAASAAATSAALAIARSARRAGTYSAGLRRGASSLKAPVGLSRCTIVEDEPFPPPNTQVVMELQEKTVRVGGRRLRYRGYRPTDRPILPDPVVGAAWPGMTAPGVGFGAGAGVPPAWQQQHQQHLAGPMAHTSAQHPATLAGGSATAMAAAMVRATNNQHLYLHGHHHYHSHQQHHHLHQHLHNLQHHRQHHHGHHSNPVSHPHHLPQALGAPSSTASGAGGSAGPHVRMSIKVPWAHPSDLHSGTSLGPAVSGGGGGALLESLNAALASGSGYMVVGAAVRQGCVMLQLHLLATQRVTGGGVLRAGLGGESGSGGSGRSDRACEGEAAVAAAALLKGQSDAYNGNGGGGAGGSGDGSGLMAAQLAQGVAALLLQAAQGSHQQHAPPPQLYGDGEMFVDINGRAPYTVAFDADRAEWRATAIDSSAMELSGLSCPLTATARVSSEKSSGRAARLPWLRCLAPDGQPGAPRFSTPHRVILVPGAAPLRGLPAVCGSPSGVIVVTFQVELQDAAAARRLAAELSPLAQAEGGGPWVGELSRLELPAQQQDAQVPTQQPAPGAVAGEGESGPGERTDDDVPESWKLVAGCLGRSLQVAVLQVDVFTSAAPGGGVVDGGASGGLQAGSVCAAWTVRVAAAVASCGQALEDAACRLAQLSLELWSGSDWCVGGVPYLLIHGGWPPSAPCLPALPTPPAPPPAGPVLPAPAIPGQEAAAAAAAAPQALAAELHALAVAAAAEDGDDCVQQLYDDLGTLELYTASRRQRRTSGDASDGGVKDSRQAAAAGAVETAEGDGDGDGADASSLLAGSLDLSHDLRAHLAAACGAEQRRAVVTIGANLLSYAVTHGMLYTACLARDCLASLGCGLAEADELTAAAGAATAAVDLAVEDADGSRVPDVYGEYDIDDSELPLLHLAGLSGDLRVVHMVLYWAAAEGLTQDWALRRHRGVMALELAAAAVEAPPAAAGDQRKQERMENPAGGLGGSADAYLQQVERLIREMLPEGPVSSQPQHAHATDEVPSKPEPEDAAPLWLQGPQTDVAAAVHASERPAIGECGGGKAESDEPRVFAGAADTSAASSTAAAVNPRQPFLARIRRQRLVVCLLGYPDPKVEAQFRSFDLPYAAQMMSYWVPLMSMMLLAALLRRFRTAVVPLPGGDTGSSAADIAAAAAAEAERIGSAEARAAVAFAWPYVVLAVALRIHPAWVHRNMGAWWLLCGAARMSTKPLCAAGIMPMPPSMVAYARSGVTLVTDTVLPALCERINGPLGLVLRALDTASHFYFVLLTGIAGSPAGAVLYSSLRTALFLVCALVVERHRRARFEAAMAAVAAGPSCAGHFAGTAGAEVSCCKAAVSAKAVLSFRGLPGMGVSNRLAAAKCWQT